ncbi:S-adenosyl-L-methionine-dependent methyltransferase [Calocera viscosa TUFC12733]|uniref:S-adenosyl-L-methionine-dependent methyltransferase n=1 Tax=Calocera viscosa (strain TUFC12733) TaxID=1330018 RepID=A0A167QPF1_CALVF|nr:S-adenosyl-L-methionine-dependent methyltransferase [Calocera viscosa TUFC12733]
MAELLLQSKAASRNGRFHAAETYLLPSDEEGRVRLDIQHRLLMAHTPMIVPSGLSFNDGDAILDPGTGTGAWLNAMAKMLPPTITVYGIDISSGLFPPPLANTSLLACSTLDLPAEWTSNFVYVHQRLMVLAFTHEAWKKCISDFYRILKPGGWIRLEEYDSARVFDGYREPGPFYGRYLGSLSALGESRGITSDNLLKITGLLEGAGFREVQFTKSMTLLCGEDALAAGAWRSLKAPFLQIGGQYFCTASGGQVLIDVGLGLGATDEELDTFMDKMEEELRGTISELMFVTWTAQKPL